MMASIVTSRIILAITSSILSRIGTYYDVSYVSPVPPYSNSLNVVYKIWPCDQLEFTVNDPIRFANSYPECNNASFTLVRGDKSFPENQGTSHRLAFGMVLWLAVAVHIVLMEFYVSYIVIPVPRDVC